MKRFIIIPQITMGTLRTKMHKQFGGDNSMMLLGENETPNEYEIISNRDLTEEEETFLKTSKVVKSYRKEDY